MTSFRIRPRIFVLHLVLLVAFSCLANIAGAENSTRVRKKTTTVTTIERESDDDDDETKPPETGATAETESSVTARFGVTEGAQGTAGCKTETLSKSVIKDLKADCQAWIKDQKTELKGRYLTSICEESCEDCGMSLKRCSVNGTVKYLIKRVR